MCFLWTCVRRITFRITTNCTEHKSYVWFALLSLCKGKMAAVAFSFKHIIVTAPTTETASVYVRQLKSLTHSVIKQSSVHCVPDPVGIRIGSGGGTLNGTGN